VKNIAQKIGWRFPSIASMACTTCGRLNEASRFPVLLRRSFRAFFAMVVFVGLDG